MVLRVSLTCVAFARLLCSFWCARSMFSVALGLMCCSLWVPWVGSQIILGVRNRQDQRGQQDRWGQLKLKALLECGNLLGWGMGGELTG